MYDNTAYENIRKEFNQKIDSLKLHSKYNWLRKYADDALHWDAMCGYYQIKAADFIDRIIAMPLEYIEGWLNGENHLEWR